MSVNYVRVYMYHILQNIKSVMHIRAVVDSYNYYNII